MYIIEAICKMHTFKYLKHIVDHRWTQWSSSNTKKMMTTGKMMTMKQMKN